MPEAEEVPHGPSRVQDCVTVRHDEHVGELVTNPADRSTVVEIDQSSADGLNTREAVGSVDADAERAIGNGAEHGDVSLAQ